MLSDTKLRTATYATSKKRKLFDGGGLYLELSVTGAKLWRLKYRFAGKEKRLAFRRYPEVSSIEARRRRGHYKYLRQHRIGMAGTPTPEHGGRHLHEGGMAA